MSEISDDEKENEVTPDTNSEQPKNKLDVHDTISRLLRRKEVGDANIVNLQGNLAHRIMRGKNFAPRYAL